MIDEIKLGFGFTLGKALVSIGIAAVVLGVLFMCALIVEWREKRTRARKGRR